MFAEWGLTCQLTASRTKFFYSHPPSPIAVSPTRALAPQSTPRLAPSVACWAASATHHCASMQVQAEEFGGTPPSPPSRCHNLRKRWFPLIWGGIYCMFMYKVDRIYSILIERVADSPTSSHPITLIFFSLISSQLFAWMWLAEWTPPTPQK